MEFPSLSTVFLSSNKVASIPLDEIKFLSSLSVDLYMDKNQLKTITPEFPEKVKFCLKFSRYLKKWNKRCNDFVLKMHTLSYENIVIIIWTALMLA